MKRLSKTKKTVEAWAYLVLLIAIYVYLCHEMKYLEEIPPRHVTINEQLKLQKHLGWRILRRFY